MADPRIEAFKRYALQQAALQAPGGPSSPADPTMLSPGGAADWMQPQALQQAMGGIPSVLQQPTPLPNIQQGANVPQVTAPQPVQQQAGPIKSFLQNFIHGAGQGMLAKVGLETDAEKQKRIFEEGIQQQQAQALSGLRAQQAAASEAQNQPVDLATYGIPGLSGQVAQKDAAKIIATHIAGQSRENVAGTAAGAKKEVAQIGADAKVTTQGMKGTQQQAHDATVAGVQRDIARGKLAMAGARLNLQRQVEAAKANGTYGAPTADRLRRADLANNAQHNLDNVITQVKQNPDLFGQIAGHFTTVQEMMGSDNKAIRQIATEIHNAALASNGAHALRSAQAVPATENMMLNHFRDSPEATIAGLEAQQDSLDTFIQDAQHGKVFVPRNKTAPATGGAPASGGGGDFFKQFGGTKKP